MTGAHAGSTLPGHGASALGLNPALAASGPGSAGGNVNVRIVHVPVAVDPVAPNPGKDGLAEADTESSRCEG